MQVEIWSDVVCPWCAIGKRRFEAALARFPHRDEVRVRWRSFELDPSAPREREGSLSEHLAAKYGTTREQAEAMQEHLTATAAGEGWTFHFGRARSGNTFDAHRLLHLAAERGVQDAVKERFLAAYLSDGEPIGDPETLVRLASEAGLDTGEARAVLDGDRYAAEVRGDEAQARAYGITGVPFFVVDGRYGVSGAQPADVLLEVLHTAWAQAHPLTTVAPGGGAGAGDACADGSCTV
ncbi:MAG TPA: DsbA family oxidoreductase [Pseudonocardia sp.]|nr:DsbA family oxidoreductase [Pseudonocardia sp.]